MQKFDLKNKNILPFRFKKLKNGKFFLSNDVGNRIVLSKTSFWKYIKGNKLPSKIKKKLIQKGFLKSNFLNKKETQILLAGKWINRHPHFFVGPGLHIMVLTLACNHACKYCHASAKLGGYKYHMTKDIAKKTVDTIFQTTTGAFTIEFQGGEPLANREVLEFVVKYVKQKNKKYNLSIELALVTNLSLITEEKLDFIIKYGIKVATSLDGPEELHNCNRPLKNGNSFQNVVYWIKKINEKFKQAGRYDLSGAIGTATKKSLEYPKRIVDTYLEVGLNTIYIRPLNPYGFAAKAWNEIGYTSEEYLNFYKKLVSYIKELRKKGYDIKDVNHDSLLYGNLKSSKRQNHMDELAPCCGASLGQVAYNRDGNIYTCDEGRMLAAAGDHTFKIGEIKINKKPEKIYKEFVTNKITKAMLYTSMIDFLPGFDQHPYSSYIGVCPISSYTCNGNPMSRYKKEDGLKYKERILDDLLEEEK